MNTRRQLAVYFAVLALALAHGAGARAEEKPTPTSVQRAEVRVGIDDGDIRGADQRALQAAVDYVASLGGGTVHIGPGNYTLRNALALRDHVRVVGVPGKTVLTAADGCKSRLAGDGGCNELQLTLDDPSGFRIGDGVVVGDERNTGGFGLTTATVTARLDARTFRISNPLYFDYMVARKATARRYFPLVGAWKVKDAAVEGLTLDGNRAHNERLDGCRGGGIYLFECEAIAIRNCVVRAYHGDGISFQVSQRVTVEDCVLENNEGVGLHPGSGSEYAVVRGNRARGNDRDGLFVCWRVKHGLFENNDLSGNKGLGISIGHKDTDNRFRNNTISGNAKAGILFRDEAEAMGAHRNVFENNRILDNGGESGATADACIVILGHHHDLVFRKNVIGYSKPTSGNTIAIVPGKHANNLQADDNVFPNVKTVIERSK